MTFRQLLNIYVQYVLQAYGKDSIVVFDNYPKKPATKDEAHMRRAGSSPRELLVKVSKTHFFANKANTQMFINLLSKYLYSNGIKCIHAEADADRSLVLTTIKSANDTVTVVNSEDTDVLILLLHLTPKEINDIVFVPHIRENCKKKCAYGQFKMYKGVLDMRFVVFFFSYTHLVDVTPQAGHSEWEKLQS